MINTCQLGDTLHSIEESQLFAAELLKDLDTGELLANQLDGIQLKVALHLIHMEVEELCGAAYQHDQVHEGCYKRWGTNPGSVKIRGERTPIKVPRVRNTEANKEQPLQTYKWLRKLSRKQQERLSESILLGISQRNYHRVIRQYTEEGAGLSKSSINRYFVEYSQQELEDFRTRRLDGETYVALILDGKSQQEEQIIICVGITATGEKDILDFVQTTTEHANAVEGLLQDVLDRGLRYEQGLLVILDGTKGLRKAVNQVFGAYAQVQRCTWHKQENVAGKIKKSERESAVKSRMNAAYHTPDYASAKNKLLSLYNDLVEQGETAAANSLLEGLEDTLTLHKLGVSEELGPHFRTTNIIENVNGLIQDRIGRVKRWTNSGQRQRWVACAIKDCRPRLNKIKNAEHLPKLQQALLNCVNKHQLKSTSNRFRE